MKFLLPVAPTVNGAYVNRKHGTGYGRVKSAKYKDWLRQADAWYTLQSLQRMPKIDVPYVCTMIFPEHLRSDLDNRAKCILDWLVSRGLTIDDKHCRKLVLDHIAGPIAHMVEIEIEPHVSPDREPRARFVGNPG